MYKKKLGEENMNVNKQQSTEYAGRIPILIPFEFLLCSIWIMKGMRSTCNIHLIHKPTNEALNITPIGLEKRSILSFESQSYPYHGSFTNPCGCTHLNHHDSSVKKHILPSISLPYSSQVCVFYSHKY